MRGGKDVERIPPMFPRLHVNDATRGGSKTSPRNKMALYERLSVPASQTLSTRMASVRPIKGSTSNGKGQEGARLSLFFNPSLIRQSTRLASSLSGGISEKAPTQYSAVKPTEHETLDAFPISSSPTFCLFQSSSSVPSKIHLVSQGVKLDSRSKLQSQGRERVPIPSLMQPLTRLQNGNDRGVKRSSVMCLQSRDSSQISDAHDRTVSVSSSKDDDMCIGSANLISRSNELCLFSELTWNHNQRSNLVDESKIYIDISGKTHGSMQDKTAKGQLKNLESKQASFMRSRSTGVDHSQSSDALEQNIANPFEKEYISLKGGLSQRSIHPSDDTDVEFVSPNDIVEKIGEHNFWRARKMICNQQRAFSMQVFELHRLIKVQRLLGDSADLLLEDNLSFPKQMNKSSVTGKSLVKSLEKTPQAPSPQPAPPLLPLKISQAPPPPAPPPLPLQTKNTCFKNTTIPVASHESCQFVPPTVSLNPGYHFSFQHQCKPVSASMSVDDSSNANTRFHPPTGNQWLVPVMSPSEGLVYKPYTGLYPPPTPGFMAPVNGACGPFTFPSNSSHLFMAAASHPQNGAHSSHNSFLPQPPPTPALPPPYGLSLTNSSVNRAVVEPFLASSCNNKGWKSEGCAAAAGYDDGLCEEGEVQQQSHVDGTDDQYDQSAKEVLPLFPVEPACSQNLELGLDCESEKPVIKVVPHSGILATQSALKIFQGMEEERRWCEST